MDKNLYAHYFRKLASLLSLLIIVILLSILSPYFFTTENLFSIGLQMAVIAIMSIGQMWIIISGGIDLSVGSVLALSGVVSTLLISSGFDILTASLVGIMVGSLCGVISGFLISAGKLPPFIATLGMMGIARGMALILTKGVPVFGLPESFSVISNGRIANLVPIPILITLLLALIGHIILTRTPFGRYTYAIGSNFEAARLSGIRTSRTLIYIYTLGGMLSGLAGIILASRLSTGQPTAGTGYELDVIAACVIGGASLSGGAGTIWGAILGALLIGVLRNGCNLMDISAFWQQVAIGALIVIAVFIDQYQKNR
ncbi:ABC transporter permease [candidate division KSB1 bacterium]|nr:ABC transporter permease [candidate division KSB1 bacterium]MBL7093271.1 ABC transporter permease [candidate division KSB1 bacterium]